MSDSALYSHSLYIVSSLSFNYNGTIFQVEKSVCYFSLKDCKMMQYSVEAQCALWVRWLGWNFTVGSFWPVPLGKHNSDFLIKISLIIFKQHLSSYPSQHQNYNVQFISTHTTVSHIPQWILLICDIAFSLSLRLTSDSTQALNPRNVCLEDTDMLFARALV